MQAADDLLGSKKGRRCSLWVGAFVLTLCVTFCDTFCVTIQPSNAFNLLRVKNNSFNIDASPVRHYFSFYPTLIN